MLKSNQHPALFILSLLHSVELESIKPAALHFVGVYLREYELCFAVVVFDGYGRVMRQKLRLYIRIVIHLVEREAAERIGVRYRVDLVALSGVICTLLRRFGINARAVDSVAVDTEPLAHIEQALLHDDRNSAVRGGADIEQEVAAL